MARPGLVMTRGRRGGAEGHTAAFQRGFWDGLTYGLLAGAGVLVIVLPLLVLWL